MHVDLLSFPELFLTAKMDVFRTKQWDLLHIPEKQHSVFTERDKEGTTDFSYTYRPFCILRQSFGLMYLSPRDHIPVLASLARFSASK